MDKIYVEHLEPSNLKSLRGREAELVDNSEKQLGPPLLFGAQMPSVDMRNSFKYLTAVRQKKAFCSKLRSFPD